MKFLFHFSVEKLGKPHSFSSSNVLNHWMYISYNLYWKDSKKIYILLFASIFLIEKSTISSQNKGH